MNGQSLEGKSFEFSFGVDKSQLSDSDSKISKAKFQNGLTKGFFKIGEDLYEGQGDLTDYEIKIYNDEGGKDKFEIKFKNFSETMSTITVNPRAQKILSSNWKTIRKPYLTKTPRRKTFRTYSI